MSAVFFKIIRDYKLLILFITGVLVSFFMTFILGNGLVFDEYYSIALLDYSFQDVIKLTAGDVHPPLFYLLLKIFSNFISVSFTQFHLFRILTLFFYICSLLLCIFPIRRILGKNVATISLFILIFLPVSFYMYSYIRMYSLASFLILGSFIYALDVFKNNSKWAWTKLFIFTLAAMYTHYYALVISFFIILALCIAMFTRYFKGGNKKNIINLLLCGGLLILIYLPWLISLYSQINKVGDSYWIPVINKGDLIYGLQYYFSPKNIDESYSSFFSSSWCLVFTFALTAMYFILPLLVFKQRKAHKEIYIAYIAIGVIAASYLFVVLYSIFFSPVYYARYLSCFTGVFVLSISIILKYIFQEGKLLYNIIGYVFFTMIFTLFCAEIYISNSRITPHGDSNFDKRLEHFIQGTDSIIYTEDVLLPVLGQMSLTHPEYKYMIISDNKPHKDLSFSYIKNDTVSCAPFKRLIKVGKPVSNEEIVYYTTHIDSINRTLKGKYILTDRLEKSYFYKFTPKMNIE